MNRAKGFFPHPILSVSIIIIWLLLNNTFSMGHLLLGTIIGILLPRLTTGFWPERIYVRRPLVALRFLGVVLYDIMVANIVVAKLVLGPNRKLRPHFLTIDLEITSPLGISALANTISLTPGTVSCDLSTDRKQLIVHALHEESPKETITGIKERYEKMLMEVFPAC